MLQLRRRSGPRESSPDRRTGPATCAGVEPRSRRGVSFIFAPHDSLRQNGSPHASFVIFAAGVRVADERVRRRRQGGGWCGPAVERVLDRLDRARGARTRRGALGETQLHIATRGRLPSGHDALTFLAL